MTREQLIRTAESLHPDLSYSKDQILEMVNQLDDVIQVDKELLLTAFMSDDNTLFDMTDVYRILDAHKGSPLKDKSLLDIVDDFKNIVLENVAIDKLINAEVTIGKSKELISYSFLKSDFLRIENKQLFLKNDDRRLRLPNDMEMNYLMNQLNFTK